MGFITNSPELTRLRRKCGDKLRVEVRVDDSDLGHIIVLSPDKAETYKVPSLHLEYAAGTSRWQHRIVKRFTREQMDAYTPEKWLEAKARIAQIIEEDCGKKKRRTHKKIARFQYLDGTQSPSTSSPVATKRADIPSATKATEEKKVATDNRGEAPPKETMKVQHSRRIKPLHRKRSPAAITADQSHHPESSHD